MLIFFVCKESIKNSSYLVVKRVKTMIYDKDLKKNIIYFKIILIVIFYKCTKLNFFFIWVQIYVKRVYSISFQKIILHKKNLCKL